MNRPGVDNESLNNAPPAAENAALIGPTYSADAAATAGTYIADAINSNELMNLSQWTSMPEAHPINLDSIFLLPFSS